MISIKQRQDKWRMEIKEEEFEFENKEELLKQITSFLELKNKYGKIKHE
jgi:hypothetical protein